MKFSRKRIGLAIGGGGPGVVEHVKEGERLLSDGGIISMIPVKTARKEVADFSQAAALVNDGEKADSAMLYRVQSTRSSFKKWINLIKTIRSSQARRRLALGPTALVALVQSYAVFPPQA
jgi:predicted acylesterase/phospholipase RssA